MSERARQNDMLLELGGREDTRLFRQNVGQAWVGKFVSLKHGRLILDNARPFHSGLCVGSSDLIGFRSVTLGGERTAVFCAIEAKTPTGRASAEQKAFVRTVLDHGGFAGFARTPDEARAILRIGGSDDE